jgi:hypothetical protein
LDPGAIAPRAALEANAKPKRTLHPLWRGQGNRPARTTHQADDHAEQKDPPGLEAIEADRGDPDDPTYSGPRTCDG